MQHDGSPRSAELTTTEDPYRGLFVAMQEALLVAELLESTDGLVDFRYIDVNPAAERMLGLPREQIVGRTARQLIPDVQQDLLDLSVRVVRTGVPETREIYEPLVAQHHHSVFFRPAPGQVAVLFSDITERKRTEEALAIAHASLERERERLDVLLSSITDHLASYDRDWRYTFVNEAAAQMLGRPREELLGRCIWEVFPEAIGNQYYQELHAAVADRRPIRSEHFYEPFNRWFENHIYPTPNGVTVFASDVTARKRAEAALRESEERFRVMADGLALMVWVHAADGEQEFFNQSACDFFGVSREAMSGVGWDELVHPDDCAGYVWGFQAALDGRAPFHATARVRRADGEWRWVESWGRPRFAGSGEFTGIVGASVDVTEHLAIQDELRHADQRKNEFLATLAHELRNPLAAIRGAIDVMRRQLPAPSTDSAAFRVLDRQVAHMVRQVDDLIDVSRISRGSVELRREATDLVQVIGHVRDALATLTSPRQQTLTISVPAHPVHVDGDPTRLAQIAGNLIGNASKFSDDGAEVQVALSVEDGCAVLRVRDPGVGIPADQIDRIFDMFTQLDGPLQRHRGGLGIGLSLVKTLVALHGGTVAVSSAGAGHGAEFTVTMPLLMGAPSEAQPQLPTAPRRHRILVVDDNRDAADMLSTLLEQAGHDVSTAYDGFEAVATAAAVCPELVILDIGMPRLNGYDTARQIRARDAHVQLVALTGWGEEADRRKAAEAGFDAHLVKPASPEQIDALLHGQGQQAPQSS